MKKIIILILVILLCGCGNKNTTIINLNKNLNIEVGESVYLYDLVNIENGSFITKNYLIDTNKIGTKDISFTYKASNNKNEKYSFKVNIIDTTPPVILSDTTYEIEKGKKFNINSRPLCGDNYDRNIKCEIIGNYDTNKIGSYQLKFRAVDTSENKTEKNFTLVVKNKINSSSYNPSPKYLKDIIKNYKTDKNEIGIDVSTWQGNIDFNKVKEDGVSFVMIRIGFGYDNKGKNILDNKFLQNIKNAKNAGLKVGIYFYSYAENEAQVKEQANWIIKTLNNEKLDLPIAFDWEDWGEFNNYNLSFIDLNKMAKVFFDTLNEKGYETMLYGSATYLYRIWDTTNYKIWLAHYTTKTDYPDKYNMWQLTSSGIVNGIDGYVDVNILYN